MKQLLVIMLVLLGCLGCGKSGPKIKGTAPKGEPHTILALMAGDTPAKVTLRGTMVEKCPVSGCWFRLEDQTGVIKVDTKSASFVVSDIPLKTSLTVAGKISQEGDETILEATGLSY